jgi:hypothetical protein
VLPTASDLEGLIGPGHRHHGNGSICYTIQYKVRIIAEIGGRELGIEIKMDSQRSDRTHLNAVCTKGVTERKSRTAGRERGRGGPVAE